MSTTKKEYTICNDFTDFISYDLYKNGIKISGGGLLSFKKDIDAFKKYIESKGYKEKIIEEEV